MNLLKKTLRKRSSRCRRPRIRSRGAQTVSGVTWDPASPLDFSSFSIAIRQFINPVSGEASGYGFVRR